MASLHTLVNYNWPHLLTLASYRLEKKYFDSLCRSKASGSFWQLLRWNIFFFVTDTVTVLCSCSELPRSVSRSFSSMFVCVAFMQIACLHPCCVEDTKRYPNDCKECDLWHKINEHNMKRQTFFYRHTIYIVISKSPSLIHVKLKTHLWLIKRLNTTPLRLAPFFAPFNQQKWSWTCPKCNCAMHFWPCAIDRLYRTPHFY